MNRSVVVYKYPLDLLRRNLNSVPVEMPPSAKVIHFGEQRKNEFCIWVSCEVARLDEPKTVRHFCFVGTGHETPRDAVILGHIGTVLVGGGSYVFHLFEIVPGERT